MTEEQISIRRVKLTARKQLTYNFFTAFKINIFVIVRMMINVWAIILGAVLAFYLSTHSSQTLVNNVQPNYLTMILQHSLILLVSWSTLWTIVDQFQQPKEPVKFKRVFQIITNGSFWTTFVLALVQNILIWFWTLCFIIPGVVKYFAYSQTYYAYKMDLLFKRQQQSLTDYITISRRVMNGNKLQLFKLEVSFLGWHLLGLLSGGLAYIYIAPYLNASRVVFSSQVFNRAMGRLKE
ncbi:DUF975 family protein [Convivina intestini]|uniref:DUF975 family protein n=1 Tax=Convivina intestini TaxID=1505726 RepID=UPI00200FB04F|nr:DUF975 family protein [Convivina intestini]CAH1850797.1 hypothetical protein R078131_00163 [Convivina intestini]